jgi:hypothetical protein
MQLPLQLLDGFQAIDTPRDPLPRLAIGQAVSALERGRSLASPGGSASIQTQSGAEILSHQLQSGQLRSPILPTDEQIRGGRGWGGWSGGEGVGGLWG